MFLPPKRDEEEKELLIDERVKWTKLPKCVNVVKKEVSIRMSKYNMTIQPRRLQTEPNEGSAFEEARQEYMETDPNQEMDWESEEGESNWFEEMLDTLRSKSSKKDRK